MAILRIVRIENEQETILDSGWDAKAGLADAYRHMLSLAWAEVTTIPELEAWYHSVDVTIEGRNIEILEECVRHPGQPHPERRVHFWLEQVSTPRTPRL